MRRCIWCSKTFECDLLIDFCSINHLIDYLKIQLKSMEIDAILDNCYDEFKHNFSKIFNNIN